MVTVRVSLTAPPDASYDILIGRGILGDLPARLGRACPAARYAVIADSHVAELYGERLVGTLHDGTSHADLFTFPAGEWNKSRDAWAGLTDRRIAAGMAEAVKHGVIADAEYFSFLDGAHEAVAAKDQAALERVVARSVEIKAAVVARDEREAGLRAVLNFGHTLAHAIETVVKYEVAHGEAVAIGMVHEARLAEALGIAALGTADRVRQALDRYQLPLELPDTARVDDLIAAMHHDKKARGGEVRFALPERVGEMHGDAR